MAASYKDIAKEAGVSVPTVQRAMNRSNKESWPGTRERAERIRMIAERLGFRKSLAAKALRSRRLRQVGVLMRDVPGVRILDETLYEILLGINAGLEEKDYSLLVVRLSELSQREPRPFRENMIDGLIVLGQMGGDVEKRAQGMMDRLVWIEGNHWEENNCIRRDEKLAGSLSAQGLIDAGRRRIAYLSPAPGPESHYSVKERLDSIRKTVARTGCILDVLQPDPATAMKNLRLPDPELGILCYNHHIAERVLSLSSLSGVVPGRDFGLASCDSVDRMNSSVPELSRIKIYRFNVGMRAAEMMINLVESGHDSKSLLLPVSWEVGLTA